MDAARHLLEREIFQQIYQHTSRSRSTSPMSRPSGLGLGRTRNLKTLPPYRIVREYCSERDFPASGPRSTPPKSMKSVSMFFAKFLRSSPVTRSKLQQSQQSLSPFCSLRQRLSSTEGGQSNNPLIKGWPGIVLSPKSSYP